MSVCWPHIYMYIYNEPSHIVETTWCCPCASYGRHTESESTTPCKPFPLWYAACLFAFFVLVTLPSPCSTLCVLMQCFVLDLFPVSLPSRASTAPGGRVGSSNTFAGIVLYIYIYIYIYVCVCVCVCVCGVEIYILLWRLPLGAPAMDTVLVEGKEVPAIFFENMALGLNTGSWVFVLF